MGVFPMNDVGTHGTVAATFFVFGMPTVLLGSIDVWSQPDLTHSSLTRLRVAVPRGILAWTSLAACTWWRATRR